MIPKNIGYKCNFYLAKKKKIVIRINFLLYLYF